MDNHSISNTKFLSKDYRLIERGQGVEPLSGAQPHTTGYICSTILRKEYDQVINNLGLDSLEIENLAGVDEVGKGAIFGIVVAAAVILPPSAVSILLPAGVKDSKALSAAHRTRLDCLIREVAIDCQVGLATVAEIATINILEASLLAMERAIAKLSPKPSHCLIDGNQLLRFRELSPLPQSSLVRGDSLSLAIASASIVAKVWRDRYICEQAKIYPGYGLEQHKGYGTAMHKAAINNLGFTDQHRPFRLKGINLEIDFKDQPRD
jgi:ribonuclease HII